MPEFSHCSGVLWWLSRAPHPLVKRRQGLPMAARGDTQHPPGYGPEQPLGHRGLGLMISRRSLSHLWPHLCDGGMSPPPVPLRLSITSGLGALLCPPGQSLPWVPPAALHPPQGWASPSHDAVPPPSRSCVLLQDQREFIGVFFPQKIVPLSPGGERGLAASPKIGATQEGVLVSGTSRGLCLAVGGEPTAPTRPPVTVQD